MDAGKTVRRHTRSNSRSSSIAEYIKESLQRNISAQLPSLSSSKNKSPVGCIKIEVRLPFHHSSGTAATNRRRHQSRRSAAELWSIVHP